MQRNLDRLNEAGRRARRDALAIGMLAAFAAWTSEAGAVVRFVDLNSPGPTHNGTTWQLAYTNLTTAFANANAGDEIWVADGTYKPTSGADRAATFNAPGAVKAFGGFQGFPVNETFVSQRDWIAHPTILSGNLGNPASTADDSFHVVHIGTNTGSFLLDGFVITRGNANGGSGNNFGGGIDIGPSGTITIRNCRVLGNSCAVAGAGAAAAGVVSQVLFVNCLFSGNASAGNAGAVDQQSSATMRFRNCTVAGNSAAGQAGGVNALNAGTLDFTNSISYFNTGSGGSIENHQLLIGNSPATVSRSCIQGLSGFAGNGNIGGDPQLVDGDGADNLIGTIDDDARLRASSPCIDAASANSVFADSDDLDGDGNTSESLPFDLGAGPRRVDDLVADTGFGAAPIPDMGAYEFDRSYRIVLVNAAATGANDGTTWANAYTSLQSALDELADAASGGAGEIWVAQGTYKPSAPAGRDATFAMVDEVELYGGFTGVEGSRSQRNPFDHKTILSGDIGAAGNSADNCFHVVSADGSTLPGSAAVLDGFVVANGNADGSAPNNVGGGIFCRNQATNDPIFRDCLVVNDKAAGSGGGAFCGSSDAAFVDCVFSGNAAAVGGGILLSNPSAPKIINCTIAHNIATSTFGGGVAVIGGTSTQIVSSILAGNSDGVAGATQGDQIGFIFPISVDHCCIESLSASLSGSGNIGAVPAFFDADGSDNVFGTADDDYRVLSCSPTIDAGNSAALPPDGDDLDDDANASEALSLDAIMAPRVRNDPGLPDTGLASANGVVDMGAYEFQGQSGGTCPADCFPAGGDDAVDVDDLFTVINHWGSCPGAPCQGDVVPLCGDGSVDIDDLFGVINAWGDCP